MGGKRDDAMLLHSQKGYNANSSIPICLRQLMWNVYNIRLVVSEKVSLFQFPVTRVNPL